jgi:hypothetical protein
MRIRNLFPTTLPAQLVEPDRSGELAGMNCFWGTDKGTPSPKLLSSFEREENLFWIFALPRPWTSLLCTWSCQTHGTHVVMEGDELGSFLVFFYQEQRGLACRFAGRRTTVFDHSFEKKSQCGKSLQWGDRSLTLMNLLKNFSQRLALSHIHLYSCSKCTIIFYYAKKTL